jgi:hypothetical protein
MVATLDVLLLVGAQLLQCTPHHEAHRWNNPSRWKRGVDKNTPPGLKCFVPAPSCCQALQSPALPNLAGRLLGRYDMDHNHRARPWQRDCARMRFIVLLALLLPVAANAAPFDPEMCVGNNLCHLSPLADSGIAATTTQVKFTGSPVRRLRWPCISNRNAQPARATFRRTPPMSACPPISTPL